MIQPLVSEQSDNNSITGTKLPGRNLTSLNELKDHGFDPDSNAPAFYWSEHKVSGSGVRNLTAKAFSLHSEQVSNAEAWFSLTISNLLIQLTESQRKLFAQCMLHAANSKHPQLSIFKHTHVPTSEDDFQKFYLSGPNAIVPNLPHPIPYATTDGTHSFVGLTDFLANELAKAATFDRFYFESNVQFLPKDVTTLSTTPLGYKIYLDLKEDYQDQYIFTYGTKSGVMISTPTIPKHPETRYGVTHSQYAHQKENLKEETRTSCRSHLREKFIQKSK